MRTYKTLFAGRSDQHDRRNATGIESIQDVTADEPGRACDQNFQSGQAKFFAHLAKFLESEIDLRVGVRGHQADSNQFVAGSNSR